MKNFMKSFVKIRSNMIVIGVIGVIFSCLVCVGCKESNGSKPKSQTNSQIQKKVQLVNNVQAVVNTSNVSQQQQQQQIPFPTEPAYMQFAYNSVVRDCPSCNQGTTPLRYKVTYGPGTGLQGVTVVLQQVAGEDSEWSGPFIARPYVYDKITFYHTGNLRPKPGFGISGSSSFSISVQSGGLGVDTRDGGWDYNRDSNGNITEMRDGMGPFIIPIYSKSTLVGYATVVGI